MRNFSKGKNRNQQYKEIFDERGVKSIEQYRTPILKKIPDTVLTFDYVWKVGDTYNNLAHKFFRNRTYWYIIALINNKPTEAHLQEGEKIKIPYDVNLVLQVIR